MRFKKEIDDLRDAMHERVNHPHNNTKQSDLSSISLETILMKYAEESGEVTLAHLLGNPSEIDHELVDLACVIAMWRGKLREKKEH